MFGLGPTEMLVVSVLGLPVYVLPTIIAVLRSHTKAVPIAIVNLLFGWTCLAYIIALVWAVMDFEPTDARDEF